MKMLLIVLLLSLKIMSSLSAPMPLFLQAMTPQLQMQPLMIPQQNQQFLYQSPGLFQNPQVQGLNPMFNGFQNQIIIPQLLQKNDHNGVSNSQPVQIILLPNPDMMNNADQNIEMEHEEEIKDVEEDLDSIVVDAPVLTKSVTNPNNAETLQTNKQKAILLFPNGRISIADIIYGIPWLPLEVNVPDTISWAYNGIASIIGGIGQRLPFRPKPQVTPSTEKPVDETVPNVKALIQRLQMEKEKNDLPIIVMPVNRQMLNTKF